jgi:hypothetical protein
MKAGWKWVVVAALGALLLASCGFGRPWPVGPETVATSREHHVVLGVGDSILGQANWWLPQRMTQRGMDVTYIDAHVNGSGPLDPVFGPDGTRYDSTLAWMNSKLDEFPEIDTVIIEYGGACSTCDIWAPWSVAYGSQAFYDKWVTNAKAMIDAAKARGKLVFYAITPPFGNSGQTIASGSMLKKDVAWLLSMYDEAVLAPYTGNPAIHWWDALSDENDAYQTVLRYDGSEHTVRYPDLVHIADDGSKRATVWTTNTLDLVWSQQPKPFAAAPSDGQSDLIEAGDPVEICCAPPLPGLQGGPSFTG